MATNITLVCPSNDLKTCTKFREMAYKIDCQPYVQFGATSFFDCWNKALEKVKTPLIALTHHDVEILKYVNLEPLLTGDVGMLGVAGSSELTPELPYWYTEERRAQGKLAGQVFHKKDGRIWMSDYGEDKDLQAMDGVFLVTRVDILRKVGIPNKDYAKWDFYDHILCQEFIKAGYRLRIAPISVIHYSLGDNFRPTFMEDATKFSREYLWNK